MPCLFLSLFLGLLGILLIACAFKGYRDFRIDAATFYALSWMGVTSLAGCLLSSVVWLFGAERY